MIAERGSSALVEHLHRRADVRGIPLSGTFELTPMCSMSCKMCYVRMTAEEVRASGKRLRTVEEWLELARVMKEQGTLLLLLTGGEPLTYPGFRELYRELRKMGFVISINSNATLIDEETVRWFAEDPPQRINITLYGASDETYLRLCNHPTGRFAEDPPQRINITLYGASDETYLRLCNHATGYTVVTHAIEMLQDAGIPVKLNCSVTPDNVCDLEQIIAYSDERKLVLQATSYMFPPLRRDETSVGRNVRFSAEECAAVESRIRLLQRGREDLLRYCESIESHCILEEVAMFDCEGDGVRCRAGKSSFWITWDGRLLLCAMMDDPSYDVFELGFPAAWQALRERTQAIRLPAECAACDSKDVCRTCAAMTRGLTRRDLGDAPEGTPTFAQALYLSTGNPGPRGEAEQGFPHVRDDGYPAFRRALQEGRSLNDAGCVALLALMARNPDTNLVRRGGQELLARVQACSLKLLSGDFPSDMRALSAFDQDMIRLNLSPGGSADLLSLCFMLYFLEEESK